MGIFNKNNKNKSGRDRKKFVGKNVWVRANLFTNSPLFSLGNFTPFGFNDKCWVRILGEDKDYYLVNVARANENSDESGNVTIEVTKEEIKKILTSKSKIAKSSVDIVEPIMIVLTDELFKVVEEHTEPAEIHNDDWNNGFIEDDDEDWDDGPVVNNAGWPNANYWETVDLYDNDTAWEYLSDPESEVNAELQIFPEPSVQAGQGGMFIFDEARPRRFETIYVDFQDWCATECDMASQANSADEYKELYRDYILMLMADAEPYTGED